VTCDPWSVVVVPFPFSESPEVKFRPAVVLSTRTFNEEGLSIMAMVTSARHSKVQGDIPVKAGTAGLPKDSLIRMKVFTLDNRLIKSTTGILPDQIGECLSRQLRSVLR
jgi:mRNA interferase MazF